MRVLRRDGGVETQQVQIGVSAQNPLADTSWEVISYNNTAQQSASTFRLDGNR